MSTRPTRLPHKAAYMAELTEYFHTLLRNRPTSKRATIGEVNAEAERLYRTMRAMIRAVVPGRQQQGNLENLMYAALTAGKRALHRAVQ